MPEFDPVIAAELQTLTPGQIAELGKMTPAQIRILSEISGDYLAGRRVAGWLAKVFVALGVIGGTIVMVWQALTILRGHG